MAAGSSAQPFVRPYDEWKDDDAIEQIFRETADPSLRHEPAWTIGYHIWALPYTKLSPSNCFVLDPADGSDQAVGYILGTPDTSDFANRWATRYIPSLDSVSLAPPAPNAPRPSSETDLPQSLLYTLYHPESLLHPKHPRLVEEFPGHLHIDIREGWQGRGYGRLLMAAFLGKLTEDMCKGVHLGMRGDNAGAERFYERLGFVRWREVMDGGESGDTGRSDGIPGTLWLVKSVADGGKGRAAGGH